MERVKASAFRWTMDAAGDWLCIQTGKARKILDELKSGKDYDVEIKEHREKRSLDANAYFWVLADRLAEKTQIPKTDIYRSYIREIGGNNETVCIPDKGVDKLRREWERNGDGWLTSTMPSKLPGCTNVVLYYGSSTYNTRQMSHLIDMAVQDCVEQGIETLSPDKLAGMMEEWGCTK
nr:MAG TPA: NinB protein [Caudoviricetes sp.]